MTDFSVVRILQRRVVRGFTLVELLVVLAIIALLISILLPTIKRARAMTKMVVCRSNLRQWVVATGSYVNDFVDTMPYPVVEDGGGCWWGVWYDTESWGTTLTDYVGETHSDQGLFCPSMLKVKYANFPGYMMNGNVATRCWMVYDAPHHENGPCSAAQDTSYRDFFIKYTLITKAEMTPFFHDSGSGLSIYYSQYGGGADIPQLGGGSPGESDFYAEQHSDIKFRHAGLANLVMLDGHTESIPGTFIGETESVWGAAYDVPEVRDHLYAEGRPYFWHYRRDPYRLY